MRFRIPVRLLLVPVILSGATLKAYWYDPRTGESKPIGEVARTGARRFEPPSSGPGNDWILALDDAAKGYPAPGSPLRP